jgi:hypothetical protein
VSSPTLRASCELHGSRSCLGPAWYPPWLQPRSYHHYLNHGVTVALNLIATCKYCEPGPWAPSRERGASQGALHRHSHQRASRAPPQWLGPAAATIGATRCTAKRHVGLAATNAIVSRKQQPHKINAHRGNSEPKTAFLSWSWFPDVWGSGLSVGPVYPRAWPTWAGAVCLGE